MAYEIQTLIDADGAPSNANTKFDNWYANHNFVQTEREQIYTSNAPREDGTLQSYDEFRVYLGLDEDLQATLSDLEAQFPDASWLVTHVRRDDGEVPESGHDYCGPDITDGLCAKVEASFDGHTLNHNGVHALVNGTHTEVSAGSYTFDVPDSKNVVTLYVDDSGTLNETGGVEVATVEVHPGRIVNIDAAEQPVVNEDSWGTAEIVRGTPPSHFENKSESLPDRLPTDNFDRNRVSQTDIDAVYTLINSHPDQETRDLASGIMNILL
jgi:hypothetical protein